LLVCGVKEVYNSTIMAGLQNIEKFSTHTNDVPHSQSPNLHKPSPLGSNKCAEFFAQLSTAQAINPILPRRKLMNIQVETGMDPWREEAWNVGQAVKIAEVAGREGWRVQYLVKLITAKKEIETMCEPVEEIKDLIESLCTS
jgi:hypothetical protein